MGNRDMRVVPVFAASSVAAGTTEASSVIDILSPVAGLSGNFGMQINVTGTGTAKLGYRCSNDNVTFSAPEGTYPSKTELMPNQVDRDLSGASAWANVDINAYNETGDLTLTASAANQYCTLPVLSAPTTPGSKYTLRFDVANLVSTWTVKSFDGTQTLGTISADGKKQEITWTASTTGGLRLVAVGTTSSGDFDNFSLVAHGKDAEFLTGLTASGGPNRDGNYYTQIEPHFARYYKIYATETGGAAAVVVALKMSVL